MSSFNPAIPLQPEREAAARTEAVACAHCTLPVPRGLVRTGEEKQFCCEGCRTVFEVIHGCGLEQFYRLRREDDAEARPANVTAKGYEEFDDPAFAELYIDNLPQGLQQVELFLDGVHCSACVWLIERLPRAARGVLEARLDYRRRTVRLTWNPAETRLSSIARQLASLGYAPHPSRGKSERDRRRIEDRTHMVRIAVAGTIAANVMVIAFALYGGMFHGIEPQYRTFFHWISMGLTLVGVAWPGRVFFRGALAAWRTRTMHMDVPISIGLAAGVAYSSISTITGHYDSYFDTLTILIFLLLVGRWIQARQQQKSRDAVELLFTMTPSAARVIEADGSARDVPLEALQAGSVVEVRAGESIPVDGLVLCGRSMLDTSLLTGESRPVAIGENGSVHAGTVNLASPLRIRITGIGESTRVGRLMKLVEESAARRAPVVRLADRIAGVFVTVILALAAITVALWLQLEPGRAVPNAMALLIVTCPCALGLATPLAIIAGIGRAARRGILIKGGEVVEQLNRPGVIMLDKTGTITEGCMKVVDWRGDPTLRPIVAQIERASSHPIARALALMTGEHPLPDVADSAGPEVREVTGRGVHATVDGRTIRIGSITFMGENAVTIPDWARHAERELTRRAVTPIFIAVDHELRAVAGVGDPIKADAPEAVETLRRRGWTVGMLSGDHPEVVAAVAKELGLDPTLCHGGITPEEKLARIQDLMRPASRGPIVMVGDGVNDAAALAAASVGIAVRGGAEASFAAADVYLNHPGMMEVVTLVAGSRRTFGVIRRNIIVSLLYNVLGVSLAMGGLLNPLVAAIVMPISSLTVITMSYRSRTFER